MTEEPYNGKCPMCSCQLVLKKDRLQCENGDYECLRVEFERLWDEFDALNKEDRVSVVIENLLESLRGLDLKNTS
jgi:hypothetical protein